MQYVSNTAFIGVTAAAAGAAVEFKSAVEYIGHTFSLNVTRIPGAVIYCSALAVSQKWITDSLLFVGSKINYTHNLATKLAKNPVLNVGFQSFTFAASALMIHATSAYAAPLLGAAALTAEQTAIILGLTVTAKVVHSLVLATFNFVRSAGAAASLRNKQKNLMAAEAEAREAGLKLKQAEDAQKVAEQDVQKIGREIQELGEQIVKAKAFPETYRLQQSELTTKIASKKRETEDFAAQQPKLATDCQKALEEMQMANETAQKRKKENIQRLFDLHKKADAAQEAAAKAFREAQETFTAEGNDENRDKLAVAEQAFKDAQTKEEKALKDFNDEKAIVDDLFAKHKTLANKHLDYQTRVQTLEDSRSRSARELEDLENAQRALGENLRSAEEFLVGAEPKLASLEAKVVELNASAAAAKSVTEEAKKKHDAAKLKRDALATP